MSILNEILNKPKSIKDINDKYDYEDDHPQGEGDSPKVSCGQNGSYNELSYIYKTYLAPKVAEYKISKQQAIDALDSACSSLENPRDRKKFYKHLESQLGIKI